MTTETVRTPVGYKNLNLTPGGGGGPTAMGIGPGSGAFGPSPAFPRFTLTAGVGNPTVQDIEFFYTGAGPAPALDLDMSGITFATFDSATLVSDSGTPRRLRYEVTMTQTSSPTVAVGYGYAFITSEGDTCVAGPVEITEGGPTA